MAKKHLRFIYTCCMLAIVLAGPWVADAGPLFCSNSENLYTSNQTHEALKAAIDEAQQSFSDEVCIDIECGRPDEYSVRLQRMQQLNLQPQDLPYTSHYSHLFEAPTDICHHSYTEAGKSPISPYYYTFLFRLTPF